MADLALPRLREGASRLGVPLTDEQHAALARYAQLLLARNQLVNLTGAKDVEDLEVRHLLDALTVAAHLPSPEGTDEDDPPPAPTSDTPLPTPRPRVGPVIDIGTGGGLPGLPLAILRPDLAFTLLDSVGKKAAFVRDAAAALGLPNVEVVNLRAELAGQMWEHRQRYQIAVARALADLPLLLEYTLPFLRLLGRAILMKKGDIDEEVARSRRAFRSLGGELVDIVTPPIQDLLPGHRLIIVEKVRPTSGQFPRRPGIPQRRPLT